MTAFRSEDRARIRAHRRVPGGAFHPARRFAPVFLLALAVLLTTGRTAAAAEKSRPPAPSIYRMADLTTTDAARLNREKTVVILPVAPIQTHGPHLPAGTDLVLADALVRETASRIRAKKPEYTVLILPPLPVGTGSFVEYGNIYAHPATISMSSDVLLTFLYDWMLWPAENAFWNFFIVSTHPGAENMRVLGEAADFFTEVYGMNTVNVTSLVMADSVETSRLAAAAAQAAPKAPVSAPIFEMHGGLLETSMMLAVDPARVEPGFKDLVPLAVGSFEQQAKTAQAFGWPGYFGVPSAATPELGRTVLGLLADASASVILDTVGGVPWQSRPKLEDELPRNFWLRETVRGAEIYQKIKRDRFDAWLKMRRDVEEENRKNRSGR